MTQHQARMGEHPVEVLWSRHHPRDGYPLGVIPVPEPISGLAFFPGGYGLWGSARGAPLPVFPVGGIMVLGHDFHSETGYAKSLKLGGERLNLPTWRNLLTLLGEVGIRPEQCFFTNMYMGLREGTATTGVFPGSTDPVFLEHCQSFLIEQINVQRPSLIITLGIQVPPLIGDLSPELVDWARGKGLTYLDSNGPVRKAVRFAGVGGLTTTVVALIHPSLRTPSLRHRQYLGARGAEAELRMLRDGVQEAGLVAG